MIKDINVLLRDVCPRVKLLLYIFINLSSVSDQVLNKNLKIKICIKILTILGYFEFVKKIFHFSEKFNLFLQQSNTFNLFIEIRIIHSCQLAANDDFINTAFN